MKLVSSNLTVSQKKLKNIHRNIKISSAQRGKIQNVWHLTKNNHACKEAGKYYPYQRGKLINQN